MVAWIPEKFAEKNKHIILQDTDFGISWCDYKVEEVYWNTVHQQPIYPEERIRAHRKNTGDNLCKPHS